MNIKFYSFCFFFITLFIGVGNHTALSQKMQNLNNSNLVPINEDYGKSKTANNSAKETKDLFKEINGTYQIRYFNTEYKIMYSKSLYEKIQNGRKENEDVTIILDENAILFLPSYKKIKSTNFKKITPSVYSKK